MQHVFVAVVERDQDWLIAYAPEVHGASGLGHTCDEALSNLSESIRLVCNDRIEDGLRGVLTEAKQTTVLVAA